jgi:tyrosine-protein kinase Etk/Wzc
MTAGIGGQEPGTPMAIAVDAVLSQIQVLKSRAVAERAVRNDLLRLRPLSLALPLSLLDSVAIAPDAPPDTLSFVFGGTSFTVSNGRVSVTRPYGALARVDGVQFIVRQRPRTERRTLTSLTRGLAARLRGDKPEAEIGRIAVLRQSSAVNWLALGLQARQREQTDVIDLQFTADDPYLAQQAANGLARAYQETNAEAAQQQSRRRRVFVDRQLQATDSVLAAAQTGLSDFRRRERVYSSEAKATAKQSGLAGLEVSREEIASDRGMYVKLLASLGGPAGKGALQQLMAAPGIASNIVVVQQYTLLSAYQAGRDSMVAAGAAVVDPDVRRLDRLIASAQRELEAAARSYVATLDARLAALDGLRSRSSAEMQALPVAGAEEERLTQRVRAAQNVADQLREEQQRARIAEAVEAGQVELVDLANVPGPIGTQRNRKILFGLLVGFLLGGGVAVLLDRMNTSIRRLEDLAALGVPNLAVVPRIAGAGEKRGLPGLGGKAGRLMAKARARIVGRRHRTVLPIAVMNSQSSWSEAYRTLRTNLLFSQRVPDLKMVVVTSALEGEGKTTTSVNLAATFAQQGVRVLLIDCDLRRAGLHKLFGEDRKPGLTNVLFRENATEEAIRATPVENLYLLPSGTLPTNPSEVLGGSRMREFMAELAGQFELLVLDTPPLLAAADAAILGTEADGVVVVVKAGSTELTAAKQAVSQLSAVGARVVGAVLNDPDGKVPKYSAYYYYEYYGAKS